MTEKFCRSCGAPRTDGRFCGACGAAYDAAGAQPGLAFGAPAGQQPVIIIQGAQPGMPIVLQAAPVAGTDKAGFWPRFWAYFLDSLILFGGGLAIGFAFQDNPSLGQALGQALNIGYFGYFWTRPDGGQTPGMRWQKLKLVRVDGSALTVGRAIIRYIGLGISIVALGLGVLWVIWDKDKQGWHDKMAGTYVLKAT